MGTTGIIRWYFKFNVSKAKISLKHDVYMNKTHWNETIFNDNIMKWKNFLFISTRFLVIPNRILILFYQKTHREGKIHPVLSSIAYTFQ